MNVIKEARLPMRQMRSIIFDHEAEEIVLRREVADTPALPGDRFPSIDSWWDSKRMSLLMNSSINVWLNLRGARGADEEGMDLATAVANVPDEARYSAELQSALQSAQGSHLKPEEILHRVKREARKVAMDKRTTVSFVGEYLQDFVETLGDAYNLSQKRRKELKRFVSWTKNPK